MNVKSFWDVEDAFFGAILGAFIGTLIDKIPLTHIIPFIFFIALFPIALRKAESISKYSFVLAIIFSIIWMSIYVYELGEVKVATYSKGMILLIIFIGWLSSITMRSMKNTR